MLISGNNINENNAAVEKAMADSLKKSYPNMSDEDALIKAKKLRRESSERLREIQSDISLNGKVMPNVICAHCHTSGQVRMKNVTRVTKSRVNSIPGKVIGLGTNSESNVKEMHCENCNMTWDVA